MTVKQLAEVVDEVSRLAKESLGQVLMHKTETSDRVGAMEERINRLAAAIEAQRNALIAHKNEPPHAAHG